MAEGAKKSDSARPTRRRLLEVLSDGRARTVTELASPHSCTLQSISKHIGVLVGAGLVKQQRRGRARYCVLDGRGLKDAATWTSTYLSFWEQNLDGLEATILVTCRLV